MIKLSYNSLPTHHKLKRQNAQMMLLIIHNPKGAMISCLINHWLSVATMIAAPGLIGIYVKILS